MGTGVLTAAWILAVFALFAGDGLRGYFAPDEMMNLYGAWFPPITKLLENERPVGALLYRALFGLVGLNPFPYRVVCIGLLACNLALLYAFCVRLAKSREVAALACLLGAYHAYLADLYYTSSPIFDLLCFLFFYLALTYYVGIRNRGAYANRMQSSVFLLLYLLALGAKEMAVTLPVFVVLFELIYYDRQKCLTDTLKSYLAASKWLLVLTAAITGLYISYKIAGARRMTLNPDYAPHFTAQAFLTGWKHYLFDLFYGYIRFNDFTVVALLIVMLAFALLTRRRELQFAWCAIALGPLPFIFLNPRGFFVMYLTLPGWYLYISTTLVLLRDVAMRNRTRTSELTGVRWEQVALFVAVTVVLIPLHWKQRPIARSWVIEDYQKIRRISSQLRERYPRLPRGTKVLFLDDPYAPDDYILYSIFALNYRDSDIRVDRVKKDPTLATKQDAPAYAHVFRFGDDLELREIR